MNVVFVCTGNLCRSPMAEGLMKHALIQRGCNGVEVTSVGTWAYLGNPAMPEAVELLSQRGIDLAEHRSRPVDEAELDAADVIVVMTSVHVRELKSMYPQVLPKVLMLKELAEIEPSPDPGNGTPEARLRGLLTGTRPPSRRSLDVDDPIGLPIGAYERCADDLQRGIDVLVQTICP
jgi:protein-tyrosine phosphatase